jgi:hypothetical protein
LAYFLIPYNILKITTIIATILSLCAISFLVYDTSANDTINSKFYPLRVDLDKTAAQERKGQTTEFIEGSINFGKNSYSPEFVYRVDNGTLLVNPITSRD